MLQWPVRTRTSRGTPTPNVWPSPSAGFLSLHVLGWMRALFSLPHQVKFTSKKVHLFSRRSEESQLAAAAPMMHCSVVV